MATHSSILSWRISWTEEPGRLLSIGLQRVGHDWSNLAQHTFSLIKRVTNIGWQTSIFWPQLKYLLNTWVFFHLLSLPLGTVSKISNLLPNSFIYMLHPNHFLLFPQVDFVSWITWPLPSSFPFSSFKGFPSAFHLGSKLLFITTPCFPPLP